MSDARFARLAALLVLATTSLSFAQGEGRRDLSDLFEGIVSKDEAAETKGRGEEHAKESSRHLAALQDIESRFAAAAAREGEKYLGDLRNLQKQLAAAAGTKDRDLISLAEEVKRGDAAVAKALGGDGSAVAALLDSENSSADVARVARAEFQSAGRRLLKARIDLMRAEFLKYEGNLSKIYRSYLGGGDSEAAAAALAELKRVKGMREASDEAEQREAAMAEASKPKEVAGGWLQIARYADGKRYALQGARIRLVKARSHDVNFTYEERAAAVGGTCQISYRKWKNDDIIAPLTMESELVVEFESPISAVRIVYDGTLEQMPPGTGMQLLDAEGDPAGEPAMPVVKSEGELKAEFEDPQKRISIRITPGDQKIAASDLMITKIFVRRS